jgi:hypothetical protein
MKLPLDALTTARRSAALIQNIDLSASDDGADEKAMETAQEAMWELAAAFHEIDEWATFHDYFPECVP